MQAVVMPAVITQGPSADPPPTLVSSKWKKINELVQGVTYGYYILGHQEESFSTLSQTFRELSGGGGAGHHMMEDSLPSSPNSSLEEGKKQTNP